MQIIHMLPTLTTTIAITLLSTYGSKINVQASWVDPDTPLHARTTVPLRVSRPPPKSSSSSSTNESNKGGTSRPTVEPTYSPTIPPSNEPTFIPNSPEDKRHVYHLVMSDEFNIPDRTFEDGTDPKWTALEKNDYTNDAIHYYSSKNAKTNENGELVILSEAEDTDILGFNDVLHKKEIVTKHFRSAMLQGWNKFCFTGGIIEAEAQLPGDSKVAGLWPAFWLLGNLARHTYVGSTNHIWPWSSTKCNDKARHAQRINACLNAQHYGLMSGVGRGSPEIDVFEVQAGPTKHNTGAFLQSSVGQPFMSTSYQVAPGRSANRPGGGFWPGPGQWYEGLSSGENTTLNILFYGDYNHFYKENDIMDYWSDAVSNNHQLDESHFRSKHRYRLEWEIPDEDSENENEEDVDNSTSVGGKHGYIRWFIDDKFVFEINGTGIVKAGLGSTISSEPMYIILNTAISRQWGFPYVCPSNCDCKTYNCRSKKFKDICGFPQGFCDMMLNSSALPQYKIDWIRVYQNPKDPRQKVGCSTPERPTRRYIESHQELYMTEKDEKPLKEIAIGKGVCDPLADDLEVTRMSCGGLTRGVCSAQRTCICRNGWLGPHCLVPDGFDPVLFERPDGFADLEFTGPLVIIKSVLWIGLGLLGFLLFVSTALRRKLDGWTAIPDAA